MPSTDEVAPELPAATYDLVAAVRDLMVAAATTEVDVEAIALARKTVVALSAELGVDARDRTLRTSFESVAVRLSEGHSWEQDRYNPWSVPLDVWIEDGTARARLSAGALHEGPPDLVHGGFSAYLMDCLLGALLVGRGLRAVTAGLEMRYRNPTPLHTPLELSAEILEVSGRKIQVAGRIKHGEVVCVEATGLFVSLENP
ncbi:MAG: PaaI family thioesterase [Nocardioides sp.]|nr:PaaI family thioesterase [Nocardioides sp.]